MPFSLNQMRISLQFASFVRVSLKYIYLRFVDSRIEKLMVIIVFRVTFFRCRKSYSRLEIRCLFELEFYHIFVHFHHQGISRNHHENTGLRQKYLLQSTYYDPCGRTKNTSVHQILNILNATCIHRKRQSLTVILLLLKVVLFRLQFHMHQISVSSLPRKTGVGSEYDWPTRRSVEF